MQSDTDPPSLLLVDDEPLLTDALGRHFTRHRFRVHRAASATEAMRVLAAQPIDVIISDEQMPGQSGSRLLAEVRRQFPDTIRMILSGQATLDAAVRAINEGEVYRFFLKPCHAEDLLHTVQQAIAHRRLERRSRELLAEFRRQAAILESIEQFNPGLLELELDDGGAILVSEGEAAQSMESLLREIEESLDARRHRLMRGPGPPDCEPMD